MSEVEAALMTAIAERLDRHLSERDYEQGCRLACGYGGDDRSEHIAADLVTHVLADREAALRERVEALAEEAQHDIDQTNATPDPLTGRHSTMRAFVLVDDLRAALDQTRGPSDG